MLMLSSGPTMSKAKVGAPVRHLPQCEPFSSLMQGKADQLQEKYGLMSICHHRS